MSSDKPETFELCTLSLQSGKEKPGWWTGFRWEGRTLSPEDIVIGWKVKKEIRYERDPKGKSWQRKAIGLLER